GRPQLFIQRDGGGETSHCKVIGDRDVCCQCIAITFWIGWIKGWQGTTEHVELRPICSSSPRNVTGDPACASNRYFSSISTARWSTASTSTCWRGKRRS